MTLNTEQIRTLIERWKMKVEVVDGEEKLQVTPPSQQELNKWINHIKNNKTLIINEIKKIKAEEEQRKANIEAIEGLRELQQAINDELNYRYEWNRRMEDEALSSISPKKPIVSVAELKKRFPRAAAYVKAENWTQSNNSGKRQAGKKALERIIAGENHEQVLADMEAEWSEYAKERMWD